MIARKARARCGGSPLPPGPAAARPAVKRLKAGGCVSMAIDELVNGRIHAPFLGPGPIAKVSRFIDLTGADVVIAHRICTRGANFEVHMVPVPPCLEVAVDDDKEFVSTVHLNNVIEPIILNHLEQWLMLHDFRFDR